ncbi:putative low-complexity protein [Arthrobacter sp. B2I5]|jgi:hypothetical protein|uniref:hypothetical protein n=1 Tax=Arthrobacter sp. B2I5 TaxID=3042266 RepID=UPI00278A214A|nr:hypothetical protein [Arthrobacter sp. B2I5]MDQ0824274.1 putative low-complexity protein [Arthrobacter sp. B2I5]
MLKKIATAAALAGALAFSAAAPAVLASGSVADNSGTSVAVGNWPDPASAKVKKDKSKDATITYVGNWPDPG